MILDITPLLSGEKKKLDVDYMLTVSADEADGGAVNLSGVQFPEAARVVGEITDLTDGPCDCPTVEFNPAFAALLARFDEDEKNSKYSLKYKVKAQLCASI